MFLIIITCIFIYKGLKFFVKLRHYFKDILNNYYNTIFTREKNYILWLGDDGSQRIHLTLPNLYI